MSVYQKAIQVPNVPPQLIDPSLIISGIALLVSIGSLWYIRQTYQQRLAKIEIAESREVSATYADALLGNDPSYLVNDIDYRFELGLFLVNSGWNQADVVTVRGVVSDTEVTFDEPELSIGGGRIQGLNVSAGVPGQFEGSVEMQIIIETSANDIRETVTFDYTDPLSSENAPLFLD